MKTSIITPIIVLCAFAATAKSQTPAPPATSARVNIGHYQMGPYEYFAEELPPGPAPAANTAGIRSRMFVLPTLSLLPYSVSAFDSSGRPISSANLAEATGAGTASKYMCRLSFRLGASDLSHFTKSLLVAHVHNKPSIAGVPTDLYTNRLLALTEGQKTNLAALQTKLDPEVKDLLPRYTIEVAPPQGVEMVIHCNGKELGSTSGGVNTYLASGSVLSVDCPAVDVATARMFLDGKFSVKCVMQIQASRVQSALAEFDLNRFYKAFLEEFSRRETVATGKSRGFLFWRKTSRSISTTIEASATATVESASSLNMSLISRDVTDESLLRRATNFIFQDKGEANEAQLRALAAEHARAADEAQRDNKPQLAAAHKKYSEMLIGMVEKKEDLDARTNAALDSIGAIASGANPYVAIGNFLARGIVWSTNESSDRVSIHQVRSATWSDTESRRFAAMIAQQASLSYGVVQGEFPELRVRTLVNPTGNAAAPESILDWNKALRQELQNAISPQ